jgi:hypothetical protein
MYVNGDFLVYLAQNDYVQCSSNFDATKDIIGTAEFSIFAGYLVLQV